MEQIRQAEKENDNTLRITRADLVSDSIDVRTGMAAIFGDGFTQWLGFFSKTPAVIARAFAHMFVLDQFYVALTDSGEIAGMIACTDCHTLSVRLDSKELRQHLGWYRGTLAGLFLKKEFMSPFQNPPPNAGSIEYVGVSAGHRGNGVASKIFYHILENTQYSEYVITEVADTNTPAMNLYRKMGFVEDRVKPLQPKRAAKIGINQFISLKYRKNEERH